MSFNAGALNAGGFLLLHMYTSHMTGFASQLADGALLGNAQLSLNAIAVILAFATGAALTAAVVNWARRARLHSVYALPLCIEALLLLLFGCVGLFMPFWSTSVPVWLTVQLLSFTMGLQNAVASKTSGGSVRTTHMTGNITDVGMELGKQALWRLAGPSSAVENRLSIERLKTAGGLVFAFVAGGFTGVFGFKYVGVAYVIPMAAVLLALSVPPLKRDLVCLCEGRCCR